MRRRKSCWAGANDGNFLPVGFLDSAVNTRPQQRRHLFRLSCYWGHECLYVAQGHVRPNRFRTGEVADKPLQRAYSNGAVIRNEVAIVIHARNLAAPACCFARSAANTPTDGSERIGASGDEIGLFKPAFRNRTNVATRIRVNWTRNLARDEFLLIPLARN
jgi:hypothetical protein